MKDKKQKDCPQCPFFNICAAYIIRDKRGENWSQRFCFTDFENCVHYQDRNQTKVFITKAKAFITRAGKKVKL